MVVIKSSLLSSYPEIIFGFSTSIDSVSNNKYGFNLSLSVGDDEVLVKKRRNLFFSSLGLNYENAAFQKQVHGDTITIVKKGGQYGESDAMITNKSNVGLVITSADCASIYIYAPEKKVIAAVHSGWRGTHKKILKKTINILKNSFSVDTNNSVAYISPSISQDNYIVGKEVAELFDDKYLQPFKNKWKLDITRINKDILIESGFQNQNVQVSNICSYDSKWLHSYRRDGAISGRALGVIAMRDIKR